MLSFLCLRFSYFVFQHRQHLFRKISSASEQKCNGYRSQPPWSLWVECWFCYCKNNQTGWMFTYGWDSENSEGMCESITLSLPRTKCENVRVLFSRIRLLFGVSVDPTSDANFQDQGPPGQATVMTGSKINTESSQFTLSVIEGGHDQLNKAKVSHSCLYILITRCITKVNKQNQLWYPWVLYLFMSWLIR